MRKNWRKDPTRVRQVISSLRAGGRNYLVDIHDGFQIEGAADAAGHLHQSDLLILDYQLDGLEGGGAKAIGILKKLMSNGHFNLVVLHTLSDIDVAFQNIVLSLLKPCAVPLAESDRADAEAALDEFEDTQAGFTENIKDSIGPAQYLRFRQIGVRPLANVLRVLRRSHASMSFATRRGGV